MTKQHTIEHITTPSKLYLMWKDNERRRHQVGELTEGSFRYLFDDEDFKEAKQRGFKGYPAFPFDSGVGHKNPVCAFIGRCQPRNRTGFPIYLKSFGLDPTRKEVKSMSDFQLLAYTGAAIPRDPFNFASSFEGVEPLFEFVLQVAVFENKEFFEEKEKIQKVMELKNMEGHKLDLHKEEDNPKDSRAIKVMLQGNKVGYIPKGYTSSFHKWMDNQQVKMNVFKVRLESPVYIYAFVSVAAQF